MLIPKPTNFITKFFHWEFWTTWVIYFPVFFYYLFLSLKARDFFFFSMANPEMEMGGLYNCSKYNQLSSIPAEFKPKTLYAKWKTSILQIQTRLLEMSLDFLLIAKPDRRERGAGVSLLHDMLHLKQYVRGANTGFLLQEYIDSPFEAGLFYYRIPGNALGVIPSQVIKNFLRVRGNGMSPVRKLIFSLSRARLVANDLLKKETINPDEILPAGTEKLLEPIGNHNWGFEFLEGSYLINRDLLYFFDALSCQIPHFYYGRFDLKAPSLSDFRKGWGFKILHVNGLNAESAHIYDPNAKFWKGVRTLLDHWEIIYKISMGNKKKGFQPPLFKVAWSHFKEWKYKKLIFRNFCQVKYT